MLPKPGAPHSKFLVGLSPWALLTSISLHQSCWCWVLAGDVLWTCPNQSTGTGCPGEVQELPPCGSPKAHGGGVGHELSRGRTRGAPTSTTLWVGAAGLFPALLG